MQGGSGSSNRRQNRSKHILQNSQRTKTQNLEKYSFSLCNYLMSNKMLSPNMLQMRQREKEGDRDREGLRERMRFRRTLRDSASKRVR